MKESAERLATSLRDSPGARILTIGALALVLQIPISMIDNLVSERQERRQSAVEEVSSKWGRAQSITGPTLVLPYAHRWTETTAAGKTIARVETRHAYFLPEQLHIRGAIDSDVRHRGIFSVPVYKLGLVVDGEFAQPRLSDVDVDAKDVDWKRAYVAVGVSDARAIQQATALSWNNVRTEFLPGTGDFAAAATGIHAGVGISAETQRVKFSFPLSLNGSIGMNVVPFGQNTVVELEGDHGNPSFQGNWLPTERTIASDSFRAKWAIPFLGRSYPQAWTSEKDLEKTIEASRFGVTLIDPVDHYRMAARSVKYAGLFIVLTFATVWLIEILSGVRVHAIQYLMLGGALCTFYLLELSLSEHLGFPIAYIAASAAVVGMMASYSIVALRSARRAMIVGASVAALFAYLYLLLMNEDYALLIGSVGLFAILGAIMFLTRRVDWYAAGGRAPATPSVSDVRVQP
jgi:inner membrane protein